MTEELMTYQDFLAISQVPISNAYEPFSQRRTPFIWIGNRLVLFEKPAILQWLDEAIEVSKQLGAANE